LDRRSLSQVIFASQGNGSITHLDAELFKMMTGVNMIHAPYRSSPAALVDLMGGRVQVMFDNMPSSIELIKSGKSNSSLGHHRNDARTAGNGFATSSGVSKSAKVVLGSISRKGWKCD
jgi:tripartite-type tricarboxylate transporter receptor subunit TctC